MNKKLIISLSVVFIISGVLIHILVKDSNTKLDKELVEFFSGFVFGIGITLPIHLLLNKNKQ
jgi:hypothetical protein